LQIPVQHHARGEKYWRSARRGHDHRLDGSAAGGLRLDDQARGGCEICSGSRVKQDGLQPNDVKCPSGVDAKVGREFDCHFTGPEGKPYTAHLKITKVSGEDVEFDIQTRPSQSGLTRRAPTS
jgi:hypothetical protein